MTETTQDEQVSQRGQALEQVREELREGVRRVRPTATKVDRLTESRLADSKNDRELKKTYAIWFMWILIGQLAIMNAAFGLAGFKFMAFQKYELELYLAGTLAEVFGIVLVITKNLFSNHKVIS